MVTVVFFFLLSLGLILVAAELFTNGVEMLGKKFKLSQAVVGSVLAAVGTALPETILPLVAIFMMGNAAAKDIGVGAILGAPFMLATLGFLVVGASVLASWLLKRRKFEVSIEVESTSRDLTFFIAMYSVAAFVPFIIGGKLNWLLAIILFGGYLFYVYRTMAGESAEVESFEDLYVAQFCRKLGLIDDDAMPAMLIIAQIIMTLLVMVFGAHMFVSTLEKISASLGMSPMIFALLLAPVATELPEKFNSITWTLKGKDSLALGNMTGAMVFQSTFPVSVGLLFTDWQLSTGALVSAIIALLSGLAILIELKVRKKLSPITLMCGGLFYIAYIVLTVSGMR